MAINQLLDCTLADVQRVLKEMERPLSILQLVPATEINNQAKNTLEQCLERIKACIQNASKQDKNTSNDFSTTQFKKHYNIFHSPVTSTNEEETRDNTATPTKRF